MGPGGAARRPLYTTTTSVSARPSKIPRKGLTISPEFKRMILPIKLPLEIEGPRKLQLDAFGGVVQLDGALLANGRSIS